MSHQEENDRKKALETLTKVVGERIVQGYKNTESFSSARIHKVPQDLRKLNQSAYTPRLIAIGPFHRDEPHLQTMQNVKMYYANYLFFRLTEGIEDVGERDKKKFELLQSCVEKMGQLIEGAKKCYAEEDKVKDDDEMAEMMLVDACFILELLCCYHDLKTKEAGKSTTKGGDSGNSKASSSVVLQPTDDIRDPILDNILIANIVKHDLLLFENQIPFFVLEELFKLTVAEIPGGKKLSDYVVSYFDDIMSPKSENSVSECVLWVCGANQKYDHILHLLHDYYGPGDQGENKQNSAKVPCAWPLTTTCPCGTPPKKFSALEVRASELHHGGVKFVPAQGNSLFDVKFKEPKGICWLFHRATFEIPTVVIKDSTEIFLRNLIAYEQFCHISPEQRYFTSYANLIDVLINSEKDVEVLSKANVIRYFSGTDEDVSKLLNSLCKEVVVGSFFEDACQQAFEYSQRFWPRFMAYWIRTYVASPWAFIGFFLALIAFGIQITSFIYNFLK